MKRLILTHARSFFILLLSIISWLFVTGQEQEIDSENLLTARLGIKGGLNLSNLYVDDVVDENMKAGLNIGLFAKIPVAKGFSIQPEMSYSSKGATISYNNIFGTGEYRFNLNYVELPVLAVFNIARNLNLSAGGYGAYLIKANIAQKNNGSTNEELVDLNEDNFKRFDYGLAGGLGFDIENFTFGVRYMYGLNEVGEKENLTGQALSNSKNSVITMFVGVGF